MKYIPQHVYDVPGVNRELERVRLAQTEPEPTIIFLQTLAAPPARPADGMIVRADGVAWNPGAGAGVYERLAGAWVKL